MTDSGLARPESERTAVLLRARLWAGLPALTLGGAVVSLMAVPVVFLGLTPSLFALLWLGWVVAPFQVTLTALAVRTVDGDEPGLSTWPGCFRRGWKIGLLAGAVPGSSATVFLIALRWWDLRGAWPALVSLTGAGVVTTLGLLAAVVVPTVALQRPDLRGWPLVLTCLHGIARRPVPAVAALAVVIIAVAAAASVSASVLVLLPVPLALVCVVAARHTVASTVWA